LVSGPELFKDRLELGEIGPKQGYGPHHYYALVQ
jgi:hypothetical protein